jgi:hypothetical protein
VRNILDIVNDIIYDEYPRTLLVVLEYGRFVSAAVKTKKYH